MTDLPTQLYRAEQVRTLDQTAIETHGIPGYELMTRAGHAVFTLLHAHFPPPKNIAVFCGQGNNAGDGYIVAQLANQAGYAVQIIQVGDESRLEGDALTAFQAAESVPRVNFGEEFSLDADIIIDALLGTGLKGKVRDPYFAAIRQINHARKPVIAVDIPSGLCANTGNALGLAVRATHTATFIGMKQGLLTGDAPNLAGKVHFFDLRVPTEVYQAVPAAATRVDSALGERLLRRRPRNAHKGMFGHVLTVGGDHGYAGATAMAAEAAARVGAGLTSVATRPEHCAVMLVRRPELMCHGINFSNEIEPLLKRATVVAIGPGLGQSDWARALFRRVIQAELPLVVDADGLNLLGRDPVKRGNWVLTPHPGEAARLLNWDTRMVQRDRFATARAIQEKFGGVVLLKGAGTILTDGQQTAMISDGNPGMASGGMGDVLTGVIAGLIAQKISLFDAAQLGAWLHATAADDCAAAQGERGLLATDLMPYLRTRANL
ncbi:MAG TPA: NAD(P)H-hydrate dehydratase [Pseudomonadales bacterium]|nr:NAD(P)H-hydrate dehydratase [Pseudomonadales bacterium]